MSLLQINLIVEVASKNSVSAAAAELGIAQSSLFGNSPEVAKKNYYTGINMDEALEVLNKRKFG